MATGHQVASTHYFPALAFLVFPCSCLTVVFRESLFTALLTHSPAVTANALAIVGAQLAATAGGAVDVVALAVSAVDAKVCLIGADAHAAADTRAAPVADHVRVLGVLAACF